ncbi:5-dehydro-2-deoxygluconokinase, partial [Enterococcus faecalis]
LKAVMLAKKNNVKIIFDIDYQEYNWKNVDEITIYYSIVAKESDIIMSSREEFDLTQRLIQPNMTDDESVVFWHNCGAQI